MATPVKTLHPDGRQSSNSYQFSHIPAALKLPVPSQTAQPRIGKRKNNVRFRFENSTNSEITRDKTESASAKHFLATGCPAPAQVLPYKALDTPPTTTGIMLHSRCRDARSSISMLWPLSSVDYGEQNHSTSKYLHPTSTQQQQTQHIIREKRTTTSLARVQLRMYATYDAVHRLMMHSRRQCVPMSQTSTGSQPQ